MRLAGPVGYDAACHFVAFQHLKQASPLHRVVLHRVVLDRVVVETAITTLAVRSRAALAAYPCLVLMLLQAWPGALLRASEPGGGLPEIRNYELPSLDTQVWSIAQDDDGILYVATNDRVLGYDGTHWTSIPSPNGSTVRSLTTAPGDRLYFGEVAELGYFELGDDGRKRMPRPSGTPNAC